MSAVARLSAVPIANDDIVVDYSEQHPHVPDAIYEATFVRHNTALAFGNSPTVFLWFKLVTPGPNFETELFRAYRVKALMGRPSKTGGQFKLSPNSLLFKDLGAIADYKLKPSRVSLSILRNCVLEVRTRTVRKGWDQKELPDWLQYSVIDQIIGTTTGTRT